MRLLFSLFIFFLFPGAFFSQKFSDHHVALTPETPPESNFNKEEYKQKLITKYKGEKSKYVDPYIEEEVFYKERFFLSNHIYTNWPEATEFVKKVFEKSIPKNFNSAGVKVYVVRDPYPNAFCMEDGDISVTTGLLAHVNTEAELAAILCHEYGHFYKDHVFEGYKNISRTEYNGRSVILNLIFNDLRSNFSKEQERQADTFAVSFFKTNGYDMAEIVKTYEAFLNLTNKQKELRAYNKSLFYFSMHPSSEERIATSKEALNKWKLKGKRFQVIDSLQFAKIKKRAIDETIYLLFEELLYPECMEMAYLQHLYEPDDEFYRFFILESLRRYMAVDVTFRDYFFITNQYRSPHLWPKKPSFEPVFLTDNERKSTDFSRSIFNHYSLVYDLDEKQLANMKAKALLKNDSIEFTTNAEAYDYFLHTQNSKACITNVIKALNNKQTDLCNETKANDGLEKDYLKNAIAYSGYWNDPGSKDKTAIAAMHLRVTNSSGEELTDKTFYKETYKTFMAIADTFNNSSFEAPSKLNFRNKNKLWNILTAKKEFFSLGAVRSLPFIWFIPPNGDFLNLFPEFADEFAKLSYKNILLLDITVSEGVFNNKTWAGTIYCIDVINKKVSKEGLIPQPKQGNVTLSFGAITALTGDATYAVPKILTTCSKVAGISTQENTTKRLSYWEKKDKKKGKEPEQKDQKEETKKASYWDKKDKKNSGKNGEAAKEGSYWERQEKIREAKGQ